MIDDETVKTLSLFLGPAIVAALITGLFSLILSRRSARIDNITQERSKWRNKIREICADIQIVDTERLFQTLQQLKLHINAYGYPFNIKAMKFGAVNILSDSHIWTIIFRIENEIKLKGKKGNKPETVENNLKQECDLLVNYLSLLLKYDWERTKNELNKSIYTILGWIFMLTGMIMIFFSPRYEEALTVPQTVIAIIYVAAVLIGSFYLENRQFRRVRNHAVSEINSISAKKKVSFEDRVWRNLPYRNYDLFSVVIRTVMLITVSFFWFFIDNIGVNVKSVSITIIMAAYFLYVFGAVLHAAELKRLLKNEYSYVLCVHMLTVRYYG